MVLDPPFVEVPASDFASALQRLIFEISRSVSLGLSFPAGIRTLRDQLADIDPRAVVRAGRFLQSISGAFQRRHADRISPARVALTLHPELAWIWIFDSNGHIREASLKALATPPRSAYECAAIAYLMNDWVPQVRNAALEYAVTYLPVTAPNVIVETAAFLFGRLQTADRWEMAARRVLEERLYKTDVVTWLTTDLLTTAAPRGPRLLLHMLRRDVLDPALAELAVRAKLPLVRAVAVETLVLGKFRWAEGRRKQWIDKTMGTYRMVPLIIERQVTRPASYPDTIVAASKDRWTVVRRALAFGLSEIWRSAGPVEDRVGQDLADDVRKTVRLYGAFYVLKRREHGLLGSVDEV